MAPQRNINVIWMEPIMVKNAHLPSNSWSIVSLLHSKRSSVEFSRSSNKEPLAVVALKSRNITAIPAAYMEITGLVFLPPIMSTAVIVGGWGRFIVGVMLFAKPANATP